MNSEYEASLRQSTVPELLVARMMLQGRRNLALFIGLVAVVVVVWARWSFWAFIVPSLIWFAATGQHVHAKLIDIELQRRQSEQKDDAATQTAPPKA